MMKAIPLCHEACRSALMGSMEKQMAALPQDKKNKMMQILPENIRKMMI
jgi:hypothetical protein